MKLEKDKSRNVISIFQSCFDLLITLTLNMNKVELSGITSGDISCSLLVNPSHTESPGQDETRVCGYIRSEFIH